MRLTPDVHAALFVHLEDLSAAKRAMLQTAIAIKGSHPAHASTLARAAVGTSRSASQLLKALMESEKDG